MAKVMKTFSLSQEAAVLLENQSNQSKAVDDAVIAMFGQKNKKNETEGIGIKWTRSFYTVYEEIEATYNGKKLTPTKALQILNRLRAIGEPDFTEKVNGESVAFYAGSYAVVLSFLKDTVAGKSPIWEDATK